MDTPLILLCSTGRAGSTLVMRSLGLHKKILTRDLFPFETRAAQYYFIEDVCGNVFSDFGQRNYLNAVYTPYQGDDVDSLEWKQNHGNSDVGTHGLNLTTLYYQFIEKLQNKSHPDYIVEKAIGIDLPIKIYQSLKTSRIIFLWRDPRDIFISMKEFNKKRGYDGFGIGSDDEAYFKGVLDFFTNYSRLEDIAKDRLFLITYDCLINNPIHELLKLFRWLDIDSDREATENITKQSFVGDKNSESHMTSANIEQSLGRWHNFNDSQTLELFAKYEDKINDLNKMFNSFHSSNHTRDIKCHIDGCVNSESVGDIFLHGWALSPAEKVNLEIYIDGIFIGTTKADLFREDLKLANIGDGHLGYAIKVPREWCDGKEHIIEAYNDTQDTSFSRTSRLYIPGQESASAA